MGSGELRCSSTSGGGSSRTASGDVARQAARATVLDQGNGCLTLRTDDGREVKPESGVMAADEEDLK